MPNNKTLYKCHLTSQVEVLVFLKVPPSLNAVFIPCLEGGEIWGQYGSK